MFTRKVLLWLSCGDFPVYELLAYSQTPLYNACTVPVQCTVLTSLPCLFQWPEVCQTGDSAKLQLSTNPVHLMILPRVSKLDIV